MARAQRPSGSEAARAAREGRLLARPGPPRAQAPGAGRLHPLGLEPDRDGLLYVPAGYRPDHPTPLILLLHGAGAGAASIIPTLQPFADPAGLILLAPESRRQTWDLLLGEFGPDVAFIDRALAHTFDRCAVDPVHIAAAGFSDGASYALSLGLANGDLFTHVLAFSPGFMAPTSLRGRPRIFISHGIRDPVLPIDNCSRRIVPRLEQAGYEVKYHEFDGGHAVPPEIAEEAVRWFVGTSRGTEEAEG
jgi:predicted esterase